MAPRTCPAHLGPASECSGRPLTRECRETAHTSDQPRTSPVPVRPPPTSLLCLIRRAQGGGQASRPVLLGHLHPKGPLWCRASTCGGLCHSPDVWPGTVVPLAVGSQGPTTHREPGQALEGEAVGGASRVLTSGGAGVPRSRGKPGCCAQPPRLARSPLRRLPECQPTPTAVSHHPAELPSECQRPSGVRGRAGRRG